MRIYTYDAIVIGTGAAGYNAACRIQEMGMRSVAIVTEGVNCGTSRNTGSDKQTYYKLGLGGDSPDSVRAMAQNLFEGGSVDGDNALCEAALSVRSFMHLCELGVGFPVNRYGEYVGYKTDHDPFARATSVGPLTSKFMTEALEKETTKLGIPVYDGLLAIEILTKDKSVCGLLCLEQISGELVAFRCSDLVIATGGPAGIYADSVYPECHTGSTSLALLAGAKTQNLTEWQYGLASIAPRWNVSGTYMQVLPRFVSVDKDGNEYEFLADYFEDVYEALSMVFLKGYQWPFDSKKVLTGSSVIDILVYRESVMKGRRVYLDYTQNPFGMDEICFEKLSPEAYEYLKSAKACCGTPIDRLLKMNAPAVDLYVSKGLDITKEYLEIALCAQHNNGGIAVDLWWQTTVRGLFAAGECAGTHGVTRPGGSALNAGQVGSLRAALYLSHNPNNLISDEEFSVVLNQRADAYVKEFSKIMGKEYNIDVFLQNAQRRMSDHASAIRNPEMMKKALEETKLELKMLTEFAGVEKTAKLFLYCKLKDILVTQIACLTAMVDYSKVAGDTRGSSLYYDESGDLREGLDEKFRFLSEKPENRSKVQEVWMEEDGLKTQWRAVRPIPEDDDFFENVWRSYRDNQNIY